MFRWALSPWEVAEGREVEAAALMVIHSSLGCATTCASGGVPEAATVWEVSVASAAVASPLPTEIAEVVKREGIDGMDDADGKQLQRYEAHELAVVVAEAGSAAAAGDVAASAATVATGLWTVATVAVVVWEATVAVAEVTVVRGGAAGCGEWGRAEWAALVPPPPKPSGSPYVYHVLIAGDAGRQRCPTAVIDTHATHSASVAKDLLMQPPLRPVLMHFNATVSLEYIKLVQAEIPFGNGLSANARVAGDGPCDPSYNLRNGLWEWGP